MKHLFKPLGLLLLLLVAQHGAVVHELSHVARADAEVRIDSGAADKACVLCPAYTQVVTPAFSHSFQVPPLQRTSLQVTPSPQVAAIDAVVPQPRSRGPPSLS